MFAMVSYQDMIVIMIIALLLFGPNKLPEIGRQVGNLLRDFRNMSGNVHRALDLDSHNQYDHGYNNYASPDESHYGHTSDTTYVDGTTEEATAIEPFSYSAPASGAPIAAASAPSVSNGVRADSSASVVETAYEIEETSGGASVYNEPGTTNEEHLAVSSAAIKDREPV